MNPSPTPQGEVWDHYRHNFSRHLLGVARYLQTIMMSALQEECAHTNLRLGFAPYITLIGEGGKRLTDLAHALGISRQACNQAVKQVEAAGYIEGRADPTDGRARQLVLSPAGQKLRRDGVRIVQRLDRQFADIVGEERVAEASQYLGAIHRHLELGLAANGQPQARAIMGGLLPRVSDYIVQRLMALTIDKGHPGLKLSFGQVLTMIGPAGGRIQQMAATQDVSKQAISALASELEGLGYLRRDTDPLDARQVLLRFTPRGEQLIADSVVSVAELDAEFAAIIGDEEFERVKNTIQDLYRGLGLEQDIFETSGATDLSLLAHQLRKQLGQQGSRELASLLLNPGTTTR